MHPLQNLRSLLHGEAQTKTGLEQELNRAPIISKLAVPEIAPKARSLAADGIVLLKNENGTLPIKPDTRVAVFGRSAVNYFTVGYGSGGDVVSPYRRNLMDGLLEHGVKVDGLLASKYETWCSLPKNVPDESVWGQWPMSNPEMPLKSNEVAAAALRCDMALVVIGRAAGEERENTLKPGSYYLTARPGGDLLPQGLPGAGLRQHHRPELDAALWAEAGSHCLRLAGRHGKRNCPGRCAHRYG